MAKTREVFICSACGAQTLQWRGQCPGCHEWNTLQAAAQPKALSRSNTRVSVPAGNRPVPLQDVAETGHHPYPSGIASLDRVLGKGLVPGAAILIGGEPGIGKSTLLLQVAGLVAAQGGRVLYASGEESLPQIKARGQRLGMLHDNLLAMSTSSVDEVIAALELAPSRLLVVDSVQTMSSVDAEGLPGNVNQVRAVSMALLEACRRLGVTLVLVGHVTKDGVLAGPRLLEHMVDTVISLEGDRRQMFRHFWLLFQIGNQIFQGDDRDHFAVVITLNFLNCRNLAAPPFLTIERNQYASKRRAIGLNNFHRLANRRSGGDHIIHQHYASL